MKNTIFKSVVITTLFVIFLKIVGFVKQAVIAKYLGATVESDIYYMAYGLITSIAGVTIYSLSMAIVPMYNDIYLNNGKEGISIFTIKILKILIIIILVIAGLSFIFAKNIAMLLAPTYDQQKIDLLTRYIKMLLPLLLFYVFEVVFSSILSYKKIFIPTKLESLFYSLFAILGCVFFYKNIGIDVLIIAQYLSYIIFILLIFILAKKFFIFKKSGLKVDANIKKLFKLSIPLIVGYTIIYFNDIIGKTIATSLSEGSVSAITYSQTVTQLVTNVIIVTIGNVLLSYFSEYVANKKYDKLNKNLTDTLTLLVFIIIPISIICFIMSKDIITLIYFRGNFGENALNMTSLCLAGYSIGFPFIAIRDINNKCFYSYGNSKAPMIVGSVSIMINILLSFILSKKLGIIGITLASSISSIIGAILALFMSKRIYKDYKYKVLLINFLKLFFAGIITFILSYFIYKIDLCNYVIINFILKSIITAIIYLLIVLIFKIPLVNTYIKRMIIFLRRKGKNDNKSFINNN